LPQNDLMSQNYNVVGNHILYDSGHLLRNLRLARLGVLPFFILGGLIVGLWARRLGGDSAAILSVLLYTTTPSVLGFSSVAYSDIVASSTQLTALYTFFLWLDRPSRIRTLFLGTALGFAFLAKLTSFLFLPIAMVCMVVVSAVGRNLTTEPRARERIVTFSAAMVLSVLVVWGGYRFSAAPLQAATGITPSNMPSFQHFPGPMRSLARSLVMRDALVPAPAFLHGVATAWVLNHTATQSYLLGKVKAGGWWYFFPVALAVKLPIPMLILFCVSVLVLLKWGTRDDILPLVCLASVLIITMPVRYQVGIRHILVSLPLIAIVAGAGNARLLGKSSLRSVAGAVVVSLMLWQAGESFRSQSDFLAYFNQLAGRDPSRVLVTGCDLDCGEDLFRLAHELHERQIPRIGLAIWSSADLDRSSLPPYYIPDPALPPRGWIAVSARARRIGDVLHTSLPMDYFGQIEKQNPVAYIGKTIQLYYFPGSDSRTISPGIPAVREGRK
jgi:hypothetical protein